MTSTGEAVSLAARRPLHIAVVAGEHSGDQLGFKLMRALKDATPGPVRFTGVGGDRMAGEGLASLFPLSEIAVMGFVPVIRRLPTLLRRIRETANAILAADPDLLVIIDSPDFTHRVAKLVKRQRPKLPVIDYVSPSVWAWRSGRAKTMRGYVDHVLALLPFEPAAHQDLGGPACSYVGHPLIERLAELRPGSEDSIRRAEPPPLIVVLPGSRRSEISRLMGDFGAALGKLAARVGPLEVVVPAVEHLASEIEARTMDWPVQPRIVRGEAAKLEAFRRGRAALTASGTATLELALAGLPMVVAYKVAPLETWLKYVVKVPSIVLPNLILGSRAIPEFLQKDCTADALAEALIPLVAGGPVRDSQAEALQSLDGLMLLPDGRTPSQHAADLVLRLSNIA